MSTLTRAAAATIAALVAILLVDYAVATRRAPRDDKLIADLQRQSQTDAALASRLDSEQKRITAAHLSRRSRDWAVSWMLIAAAAVFILSSGRLVGRTSLPAAPARNRKPSRPRFLKPPAAVLKSPNRTLIRYRITDDCIGCTVCAQVCPKGAIRFRPYEKHRVDHELCTPCDMCRRVCQEDAVEIVMTAPAPVMDSGA